MSGVRGAPPGQVGAWLAEGQRALDTGHYRSAAEAFARVYAEMPRELTVARMVAHAWRLAGDVVAERQVLQAAFRQALPGDVQALHELGGALLETGAATEARACFDRVVKKRPKDAGAIGALASAMRAEGNPQRAWVLIQQALKSSPRHPTLLLTAAQIRYALHDARGSLRWLDQADAVRPEHQVQRQQRAFSSLVTGPSAAGWAHFEARGLPAAPNGSVPWTGEPLEGRSILVVMEQGLGDLFHFARYIPLLRERGARRIVIEVPASAVSLFETSGFTGDLFVACTRETVPATDLHVPVLSLPHRLAVDADTVPGSVPYLHIGEPVPTPARPARRVGLVWKGNPAFPGTHLRDLDAASVRAIVAMPGIEWVSLQFGAALPEALTPSTLCGDWLDTAR